MFQTLVNTTSETLKNSCCRGIGRPASPGRRAQRRQRAALARARQAVPLGAASLHRQGGHPLGGLVRARAHEHDRRRDRGCSVGAAGAGDAAAHGAAACHLSRHPLQPTPHLRCAQQVLSPCRRGYGSRLSPDGRIHFFRCVSRSLRLCNSARGPGCSICGCKIKGHI